MSGQAGTGTRLATTRQLLREPALPILLLTSVAMVRREYLPDIALALGAMVLVLLDAPRWGGRTAPSEPTTAESHPWRTAALAVPVALALAVLPRESRWLDLGFAIVGLVALGLAWLPGRPATASPGSGVHPPRRWWLWPAVGVSAALVELFSFLHDVAPRVDDPGHPTLSNLVEPALGSWPVRGVVLWLWLLAGWWLWRRLRAWAS